MRSILAAILAAVGGFGGAIGYDHYVTPAQQAPQIIVQSDPQLHADLVALGQTMNESLRLNQEAWAQQVSDRAQRQSEINKWRSSMDNFDRKVK